MHKLSKQGNMFVRSFMTDDQKFILVVVKSSNEMCLKMAQEKKLSKQIELGAADLFSLEPVDKDLRPLRLKNFVNDYKLVRFDEYPDE